MYGMNEKDIKELTDALRMIGVTYQSGTYWPVVEDNYIKFMSHNGTLDAKQCDQFEEFLRVHGVTYERHRERAIRNIDDKGVDLLNQAFRHIE